jgi:short-subunit dehydrogenase
MSKADGRRVLLTGASSGIGAALARCLADGGDEVWLAARRADRLASVVDAITKAGGKAHAVALDIGDLDALEARIGALDDEAGGFDLVIANAGIGGVGAAASGTQFDEARKVFDINFTGTIGTLLAAMHKMLPRGRGHLVAVSSLAGELALPVALDYGTSKAGLSYFVRAMRHDLKPKGVDVTLILPGFVRSEITDKNDFPMPFIIPAEKAAAIIARGIARRKKEVRFPLAYRLAFIIAGLLPLSLVGYIAVKTAPPDRMNQPP